MENNSIDSYKLLVNDIISKQSIILGPQIAILKAKNVEGLKIDDKGIVLNITGNLKSVVSNLIDQYVSLSGEIIKGAIAPLFDKYPDIKL
jgi:hypothetical protein